jgi:hypothetical protein
MQHLTLSVSDSIFINPVGAAVVWSPAIPGSITDCAVRGNRTAAEPFFPSCMPAKAAGEWQQAPVNTTLLQVASASPIHDSHSPGSLGKSVIALAANSEAVSGPPETSANSGQSPIAHLHLHVPSEAYFMSTVIQEVTYPCDFGLRPAVQVSAASACVCLNLRAVHACLERLV